MNDNAGKIITLIARGALDEDLERITAALLERRKVRARRQAYDAQVGDRFMVGDIKPKYLSGKIGRYTGHYKVSRGQVVMELDMGATNGRYGQNIMFPSACLTKLA